MPPEEEARIAAGHRAVMEETAKRGIFRRGRTAEADSNGDDGSHEGRQTTDFRWAIRGNQGAISRVLHFGLQRPERSDSTGRRKIPTGCKGGEGCIEIRPIAAISQPRANGRPGNTKLFWWLFRRVSTSTRPHAGETGGEKMEYLLLLYESENVSAKATRKANLANMRPSANNSPSRSREAMR